MDVTQYCIRQWLRASNELSIDKYTLSDSHVEAIAAQGGKVTLKRVGFEKLQGTGYLDTLEKLLCISGLVRPEKPQLHVSINAERYPFFLFELFQMVMLANNSESCNGSHLVIVTGGSLPKLVLDTNDFTGPIAAVDKDTVSDAAKQRMLDECKTLRTRYDEIMSEVSSSESLDYLERCLNLLYGHPGAKKVHIVFSELKGKHKTVYEKVLDENKVDKTLYEKIQIERGQQRDDFCHDSDDEEEEDDARSTTDPRCQLSLFDYFSQTNPVQWKCPGCGIAYVELVDKCDCCGTQRVVGSASDPQALPNAFGTSPAIATGMSDSSGGFSFGTSPGTTIGKATSTSASSGGFSSGTSPGTTIGKATSTSASSGGFSFGTSATSGTSVSSGGFSFGTSSTSGTSNSSGGFSFGTSPATAIGKATSGTSNSSGAFSFGTGLRLDTNTELSSPTPFGTRPSPTNTGYLGPSAVTDTPPPMTRSSAAFELLSGILVKMETSRIPGVFLGHKGSSAVVAFMDKKGEVQYELKDQAMLEEKDSK